VPVSIAQHAGRRLILAAAGTHMTVARAGARVDNAMVNSQKNSTSMLSP